MLKRFQRKERPVFNMVSVSLMLVLDGMIPSRFLNFLPMLFSREESSRMEIKEEMMLGHLGISPSHGHFENFRMILGFFRDRNGDLHD